MIAFGIVLLKKQLCKMMARVFLEIYGGKEWEGDSFSEDFKFRYCHKITKLESEKILDNTMILVTTPQEHQIG